MSEHLNIPGGGVEFAALAQGAGPLVLLLHGFPDSKASFAAQLPALADAGFRAVAPTLRGYAPAAIEGDDDYHALHMAEDVVAIANHFGADRFHLVGHDWGAAIGFVACAIAPSRIASFTALAVPHPVRFAEIFAFDPEQQARSAYMLEFQSPDAETLIARDSFAYLEALWRRWSPGWTIPASALEEMRKTFAAPGVAAAALAYYRQAFDTTSPRGMANQKALAGPFSVPTLGVCGEEDGCVSADVFTHAMKPEDFPAGLSIERLAGAGHFLHRETPETVNRLMIGWMRAHPV